jgi:hypothetical protein
MGEDEQTRALEAQISKFKESVSKIENERQRLETVSSQLMPAAKTLRRIFTIRQTISLICIFLAMCWYGGLLSLVVILQLITKNFDLCRIGWHNVVLLLFPTVAFALMVWAIVKIYQAE